MEWNGGTGNWNDPTLWTPKQVPRPGDFASLGGGTVYITNVNASDIPIIDGWNLEAFQQGDQSALDQDTTLDITNSVIGDVRLEGGNPVTPHGAANAVWNLQGIVTFRGDMGIDNAGEGAWLQVTVAPGSIVLNQGQWALNHEGPVTASIAMGPGSIIDNEGGIYIGIGFGRLTISGDVSDQIVNNGTIAAAGQMVIGPSVVGKGAFEMGADGFLGQPAEAEFQGRVGPEQTFAFDPQPTQGLQSSLGQMLILDQAREFLGKIANFAPLDTIDLPGVTATGSQFRNGTLTLYNGHAPVAALHFTGSYAAGDFAVSSTNGATTVTHT